LSFDTAGRPGPDKSFCQEDKIMRSDYVFAAVRKIQNRFLLCGVTIRSAHRLQKPQKPFTESINQSLNLIAGDSISGSQQVRITSSDAAPDVLCLKAAS
jgi:hypothetical protein